jgi:hypothetical protein
MSIAHRATTEQATVARITLVLPLVNCIELAGYLCIARLPPIDCPTELYRSQVAGAGPRVSVGTTKCASHIVGIVTAVVCKTDDFDSPVSVVDVLILRRTRDQTHLVSVDLNGPMSSTEEPSSHLMYSLAAGVS